jgi:hypothetical protein
LLEYTAEKSFEVRFINTICLLILSQDPYAIIVSFLSLNLTGRVNTDFKSGTSIAKTVLRQCIQVDSNIYNIKATLVKNAALFLRIEFSLTLCIKMETRRTKRKLIY